VQNSNRPQIDPKALRKSLITWGIIAAIVIAGSTIGWGTIWHEGLIRPMLNILLFFYANLGHSFVIAITALTLFLRLLTWPLFQKQMTTARRTAEAQPRMQELQKKYAGDKARLAQEQQKLYRELGINPLGGCLPTLIQFPIWISLYQSINTILADTPLELLTLGKNVYSAFRPIVDIVPLQSSFLWLDLARPDPSPFVMPILVGGTMWLQQKLMSQPSSDPQQASMNQTMQLMMPLMFGYFTMNFASGLAIYFVISNVIGIIFHLVMERVQGPVQVSAAKPDVRATNKDKASYGRKRQRRKAKR
jgi:YidC/Oxa1 family membrane protein insertase